MPKDPKDDAARWDHPSASVIVRPGGIAGSGDPTKLTMNNRGGPIRWDKAGRAEYQGVRLQIHMDNYQDFWMVTAVDYPDVVEKGFFGRSSPDNLGWSVAAKVKKLLGRK